MFRKRNTKPRIINIRNKKIINHPEIRQAIAHDTDLIQVSSHNTVCDICQRFEGKIFSITGADKRFPMLTDVPPFCDNCRHSIHVTFETALTVQKILKKFIEFSNGRTEKHPFDKNFIPISNRPKIDLDEELKLRKRVIAINKKIVTRERNMKKAKSDSVAMNKLTKELFELNKEKESTLLKINTHGGWGKLLPRVRSAHEDLFSL